MAGKNFHWLDVERIAEGLEIEYPEHDPLKVRFPELRTMVTELDGFEERHGHPCNEKILEAIQMAWLKERQEGVDLDDFIDEDGDDDSGGRPSAGLDPRGY